MVSRLGFLALVALPLALTGCDKVALQCPEWVQKTLPIKPSRSDKLTLGTQDQILGANESWEQHCK